MTPDDIRAKLRTRAVGGAITCVESCESTNDLAWRAALEGAPHGAAFFADEQTKGRGRRGRTWLAEKGRAILGSVLLRSPLPAERSQLVTALGALAVTDVASALGVPTKIRFPNDVYAGERKLSGVLAEARFIGSRPDVFILGIGLNVNGSPKGEFPATSLAEEKGHEFSLPLVARSLLEALDEWVALLEGPVDPFQRAWRERSELIGRAVRVTEAGRTHAGSVTDVDVLEGITVRLETGPYRLFRAEYVEKLETQK
jgi:BirA family transcriptional regulator, biotin operon repressor / biotin---[acetyl-CoA-carboxylase] ligase